MGLDMYLTAERYLWSFPADGEDTQISKAIAGMFPEIGQREVKTVSIEAMYWRKANQIHKWFVDHCQDGVDECQRTMVTLEQLAELQNTCKQVQKDHSLAQKLLPAQSGFFFGSTDYDDWYYSDIDRTVEGLDSILSNPKFTQNWDFYYQSSW